MRNPAALRKNSRQADLRAGLRHGAGAEAEIDRQRSHREQQERGGASWMRPCASRRREQRTDRDADREEQVDRGFDLDAAADFAIL